MINLILRFLLVTSSFAFASLPQPQAVVINLNEVNISNINKLIASSLLAGEIFQLRRERTSLGYTKRLCVHFSNRNEELFDFIDQVNSSEGTNFTYSVFCPQSFFE